MLLHVVLHHDGSETRRSDGALVPVVAIAEVLTEPLADVPPVTIDWSRFGQAVCATDLAGRRPDRIRGVLWRLGDARVAAKAARIEARLTVDPPAEVLYQEVWDGLGFSANREPMRALATLLPLAAVEGTLATVADGQDGQRAAVARGLLFGAAGFLPLSPADAAFARLDPAAAHAAEAAWVRHGAAWHSHRLPATAWTRARVRPANHPAARLAAGASLLAAAHGGLLAALLAPIRGGADPVAALRDLSVHGGQPGIGEDRANGLMANAVLPFAFALAEHSADAELADAAAATWEHLPAAEPNEVTRRAARQVAGDIRLPGLGARGQQGLIHLDTTLCAPRRCYECPIAHAVAADVDVGSEPTVS